MLTFVTFVVFFSSEVNRMFPLCDVLTVDWFYVSFRFSRNLSCSLGVDVGVRSGRCEEEEEGLLHQQVSDLIWFKSDCGV